MAPAQVHPLRLVVRLRRRRTRLHRLLRWIPNKPDPESGEKLFRFHFSSPRTLTSTGGQCCKTFFVRNLRIFIISLSVCPWQAFQAWSNKHSSLLQKSINYGQKKFYNIGPSSLFGVETIPVWEREGTLGFVRKSGS